MIFLSKQQTVQRMKLGYHLERYRIDAYDYHSYFIEDGTNVSHQIVEALKLNEVIDLDTNNRTWRLVTTAP